MDTDSVRTRQGKFWVSEEGQEGRLSVIPNLCPLSTDKAPEGSGLLQSPHVEVLRVIGKPLALAPLTTVLLKGGDIIRGHASEYRMWNIINKLTLLKWGL